MDSPENRRLEQFDVLREYELSVCLVSGREAFVGYIRAGVAESFPFF